VAILLNLVKKDQTFDLSLITQPPSLG